jgi:hypothetical protein
MGDERVGGLGRSLNLAHHELRRQWACVGCSSIKTSADFAIVLTGFLLLTAWHAPPFVVVILGAFSGIGLVELDVVIDRHYKIA